MQTFEHELDPGRDAGGRLTDLELGEHRTDAFESLEHRSVVGRGDVLAGVHDRAVLERSDDGAEVLGPHSGPEHLEHRGLHDALQHLTLAAVLERLDLDLSAGRGRERVEVRDARDDVALAARERATCRVGDERFVVRDRQPRRHTRPLVHVR